MADPSGLVETPAPLMEGEQDVEYAVEGSEQAPASAPEPEEYVGKDRATLIAELGERQQALEAAKTASSSGTSALTEALKALQPAAPASQGPAVDGSKLPDFGVMGRFPNETEDAYNKRIEQEMITNPAMAVQRMADARIAPLAKVMAENMLRMNRRVVLLDPKLGKVYERYSHEVEAYVAAIPPAQKLGSSDLYEEATRAIQSRHVEDLVDERAKELAGEMLKAMGIDPAQQTPAAKAAPPTMTKAAVGGSVPPAGSGKKTVVIPKWFANDLARKGIVGDALGDAWEAYKEQNS